MLRKLIVAMAAAGAISAGPALGLGLGEVTINSYLNQPLDAEIELVQVRELSNTEILPNLATRDDFRRAGVERPFFLSDLKFETVVHSDGRATLHVTSRKPVVEPSLNFLVEVHWPSGRLLREYTLLLDPPSFSARVAEEETRKPGYQAGRSSRYQRIPDAVAPVRPSTEIPSRQPAASSADSHKVKKDETLWDIALRYRPGRSVSAQQMMLAIQAENPRAFINGNINMLKQGSVLRIPDRVMLREVGEAGAVGRVAKQNATWKGSVRQLDATRRTTVDDAPEPRRDEGRLTVVSSGDTNSGKGADQGGGSGDSARVKSLESDLSVSTERIDLLSRENAELREKLDSLAEQLQTLQRLITLKNNELAVIQSNGQAQSNEPMKPPVPSATLPPPVNGEDVDYNYQTGVPPGQDGSGQGLENLGNGEQQGRSSNELPSQKPGNTTGITQEKREKPFIDQFLSNPLYLGLAGGGVLFLIAGLIFVARRRTQAEDVFQDSLNDQAELVPAGHNQIDLGAGMNPVTPSPKAADAGGMKPLELDADLEIDQDLLNDQVAASGVAGLIAEAEVYAEYGRYQQASEMLEKAVATEPGNSAYRLKLMVVQAQMGDLEGFREQLAAFGTDIDEATRKSIDALKPLFADAASTDFGSVDAFGELDALTDDLISAKVDLDDNLDSVAGEASSLASMDDLSLELDLENEPGAVAAATSDDNFESSVLDELEVDLDLGTIDLDTEHSGPESDHLSAIEDISLDLGDAIDEPAIDSDELMADLSLDDVDISESSEVADSEGIEADDLSASEDISLDLDDSDESAIDSDELMTDLSLDDVDISESPEVADSEEIESDDLSASEDISLDLDDSDESAIDSDELMTGLSLDDVDISESPQVADSEEIESDDLSAIEYTSPDLEDDSDEPAIDSDQLMAGLSLDDVDISESPQVADSEEIESDDLSAIEYTSPDLEDDSDEPAIDSDELMAGLSLDDVDISESPQVVDSEEIESDDLSAIEYTSPDLEDDSDEPTIDSDEQVVDLSLDEVDTSDALEAADPEVLDDLSLDLERDDSLASEPPDMAVAETEDVPAIEQDASELPVNVTASEDVSAVAGDESIGLDTQDHDLDLAVTEPSTIEEEEDADEPLELIDLDMDLDKVADDEPSAVSGESEDESGEGALAESGFDLEAEIASLDTDLSDLSEGLGEADLDSALQPESVDDVAINTTDLDSGVFSEDLSEMWASDGAAMDDDFEGLEETNETATKLDLARAYIEMGDQDGARDILEEVIREGGDTQKQEARELLKIL